MDYQHVMADEFFEDIHLLHSRSKEEIKAFFASKLTVWIAISNEYRRNPDSILNTDVLLTTYFSGFKVARMDAALRMTGNNAMRIKSNYQKIQKFGGLKLNGRLCAELKVPPNLVEGWKHKIIGLDKVKPLSELVKEAFACIPKDNFALLIIDDRVDKGWCNSGLNFTF